VIKEVVQDSRDQHFERGGGAQTGGEQDIALQSNLYSPESIPPSVKAGGDSSDKLTRLMLGLIRIERPEVDMKGKVVAGGVDDNRLFLTRGDRRDGVQIYCRRDNHATIVVCVISP
jgi:hypothetical protein